jgi:hypothetical protein
MQQVLPDESGTCEDGPTVMNCALEHGGTSHYLEQVDLADVRK